MNSTRTSTLLLLAAAFLMAVGTVPPVEAAATITVVNNDGAGEGFNDASAPDAASTAGGNTGATLGAQRLMAFQFAADIWANQLESSVTVRVGATFDPLIPCTASMGVLGSAGANTAHANFTNAPVANTLYPAALANKLAATDLSTMDDIGASFNSNIGTTGCLAALSWYFAPTSVIIPMAWVAESRSMISPMLSVNEWEADSHSNGIFRPSVRTAAKTPTGALSSPISNCETICLSS